jgi:putative zinc finger protein
MTEVEPARVEHTDVAAYAMGLLEEADRGAFVAHLEDCPRCARELAELAGMRELVAQVRPSDADLGNDLGSNSDDNSDDNSGNDLADVAELPPGPHLRSRRRFADRFAIVAAAAALLFAGMFVGSAVSGSDDGATGDHVHAPAADLLLYGQRFAAADPATGATGVVGMEQRGFGTHVALELRGVHGPLRCSLVVVSRSGVRETAASWGVPVQGYGVPEAPNPLVIHGATSIPPDDIASFEIATAERTLVSVPAGA